MMGGTIHSAKRNCRMTMLLLLGAGAHGPQSPAYAMENTVITHPTPMQRE